MLLKIRTHVHMRVHILRVNFQVSNQSDRVDTDAQIVQHRGETLCFFREKKKKRFERKKSRRKKCLGCTTLIRSLGRGKRKKCFTKPYLKAFIMGSSSDALLERISNNTPKKTKNMTPAANTVRRSRRLLGPSVSIVGDVGENEETPLGKIRETVTTTTTSRLGGGKGGANKNNNEKKKTVRSPLMDRGNERDVITVEEEEENGKRKKEKKKSEKRAAAAGKKTTKAIGEKKREKPATAARKTRKGTKEQDEEETEEKDKKQPEEESTMETYPTTTTASADDNHQDVQEQEKIQEEMDNEDPMQILKLAVATWQKRGVDPSEAIFEAFPLRLSERKDGATMRRLMAALAGVELAPTTVKKARAIREEMFEDVEEDGEEVCDMVEDKEDVGESKADSKQKPNAELSLEDHATRRLSFGSGNGGEKEENAKEQHEEEVVVAVAAGNEEEDEEFGTPEGKIEDEEGDIEGTFDPCNCGELECPKEKMLKNNGPFQLPVVKHEQPQKQMTPIRTWMDAEQPSLDEENEEEADDSESVAATDIDENYSVRDEEEEEDNEDDDVGSIAGTEHVASPLVESIIERASKKEEEIKDEPAPPEKEVEVEEEDEVIAARPKRNAATKKKVQILSSSDEDEEAEEAEEKDTSAAPVRASRRVANKRNEIAEKISNRRRNQILEDSDDYETSEDEEDDEDDDDDSLSEIAEEEEADDSEFAPSDDEDDEVKPFLKTAMKTAMKTPGPPAKTPGRVNFKTPTPPKTGPNTLFRAMTDKKCNTALRAARLAAMEDEQKDDDISPFNLERLQTPPNEPANMSPTKTFSAWKPPPSHSKALTSALKSVGKTIGGNLKNGFDFNKHKESITRALFDEFNANVFDRQLPDGFEITWSKKLLTTAGLTVYKRTTIEGVRHFTARIELSTKVLDSVHKLEATLLHEMCHASAWLVDHVAKPPHGDVFKKWAKLAMQTYPGTNVSTCHAYAIHTPFKWKCSQTWCEQEYGRHSKSIDVEKKRCGLCGGRLEFMGKFTSDGVLVKGSNIEKKATGYAKFVQDNFGDVKKELGNKTPHKKIMEKLSEKWNEEKKAGKKSDSGERSGSGSNNESFSEDKENIPKEAPGTISKAAARFTKLALFEDEIMSFTEKKKKKSVSIQEEEDEVETKMKAMNLNSLLLEEEEE